jgi:uncharacterized lipoprotein NlpE involved in copper resistance
LNAGLTYTLYYHYIDGDDADFTISGSFQWDEDGRSIMLDAEDVPPYYQVGENKLIQLDMEGNPITGMLAGLYVLNKQL